MGNKYELKSLVEEIMNKEYDDDCFGVEDREKDYQMILEYFKRLKKFMSIDLDKVTLSEETKPKVVKALRLLLKKENGYYTLMKKVLDKKNVNKDRLKSLNQELNNIFEINENSVVIQKVHGLYESALSDSNFYFMALHKQIENSQLSEAEKYNILIELRNFIVQQGKNLMDLEDKNSKKQNKYFEQRGKQNLMMSEDILSEIICKILSDISFYPSGKGKTSEESYIIKYLTKDDFQKAIQIKNDIESFNKTISSIKDIKVKEIYVRGYPNIYKDERKLVEGRMLKELN